MDQGKLLANAVRWAADEAMPVEVMGQGVVDLAVWRQKGSMTVHLVNLTNPMMMKGPIREVIAMPPQVVRLRVPDGERIGRVRLLVAARDAVYNKEGDVIGRGAFDRDS